MARLNQIRNKGGFPPFCYAANCFLVAFFTYLKREAKRISGVIAKPAASMIEKFTRRLFGSIDVMPRENMNAPKPNIDHLSL